MRAAPLVADPSGDANGKSKVEIGPHFCSTCSEAVRDTAQAGEFLQYRQKVLVSVALMQEHGFVEGERERQLCAKCR